MDDKYLECHTSMYNGQNNVLTKGKEYPIQLVSVEDFVIINDEGHKHFFNKGKDDEGESYLDWFYPVKDDGKALFRIVCKVCNSSIGYSETDDNGNAMCLHCYYD
ncbi:MAG: hypothetical protein ACQEXB_24405 [Bacillota bacterium]